MRRIVAPEHRVMYGTKTNHPENRVPRNVSRKTKMAVKRHHTFGDRKERMSPPHVFENLRRTNIPAVCRYSRVRFGL